MESFSTVNVDPGKQNSGLENVEPTSKHDQLPDVEEYKASQGGRGGGGGEQRGSKNWMKILFTVVSVVVLAVMLVAIGFTVGQNSKKSNTNAPKEDGPEETTTTGIDDGDRAESIRFMATGYGWSDKFALTTFGSPQFKAVMWLAERDPMAVPLSDRDTLKERYALAVLYYGLNGEDWRQQCDFLDNEHVCDWFDVFVGSSGRVRVGVDCNFDNRVTKVFLPYLGLDGSLPSEIGLLDSLVELDLSGNDLTEELPTELGKLTDLEELILHNNDLSGVIPTFLSQMSSLEELHLASNNFKGSFPAGFSSLPNLYMLNVDDTFLKSMDNLAGLSNLRALFLGGDVLEDGLTSEMLASWPKLEVLDLNMNGMESGIPDNLFTQQNLVAVDLSGNSLTGSIPLDSNPPLGMKMEFLNLNKNRLTGTIPGELRFLKELRHLDLSENGFTGPMPSDLGLLDNLEYLFLAYNEELDEGPIPESIGSLPNLRDLSLKSTNRKGPIPDSFQTLESIRLLDLGKNDYLNGNIPKFLGDLSTLRFLILNGNNFTGNLPQSLAKLPNLNMVAVNDNDLEGSMQYMCNAYDNMELRSPAMYELIADCANPDSTQPADVECTCCRCCHDVECKNIDYFSNLQPMWENGFVRQKYVFKEDEIDLGTYKAWDENYQEEVDRGFFSDHKVDWANDEDYYEYDNKDNYDRYDDYGDDGLVGDDEDGFFGEDGYDDEESLFGDDGDVYNDEDGFFGEDGYDDEESLFGDDENEDGYDVYGDEYGDEYGNDEYGGEYDDEDGRWYDAEDGDDYDDYAEDGDYYDDYGD